MVDKWLKGIGFLLKIIIVLSIMDNLEFKLFVLFNKLLSDFGNIF